MVATTTKSQRTRQSQREREREEERLATAQERPDRRREAPVPASARKGHYLLVNDRCQSEGSPLWNAYSRVSPPSPLLCLERLPRQPLHSVLHIGHGVCHKGRTPGGNREHREIA